MNEMDLITDFCNEPAPPGPERLATARARMLAGIQGAAPSPPALSNPRRAWRAMLTRPRLVISGGITAAAAVAVAVAIVAGVIPMGAGPARHAGSASSVNFGNRYPLGPPPLAEKTTVAGAQAKAGYPVAVPSTPAANRANLTQAWVAPRNGDQVALVFDKGKIDIMMQPSTYQGALSYFRAFVAQKKKNGAPNARIGQVNGRPALVTGLGGVNFWRNGVLISIYSNTRAYGTHTLLAIASSMR